MRVSLKCFWALVLLLSCPRVPAFAGQQIYLSESPNARFRVIIEQVLERRVGDRTFFRYPLMVVNAKNPKRHFEVLNAGSPLVKETEKGTFQVNRENLRDTLRFDWAKDSEKFFLHLETLAGTWRTYFVDVNTGKTRDVTAELQEGMAGKIASKKWDCQQPEVALFQWIRPHLAFFKLNSICGKERTKLNEKLFPLGSSVLFDTTKGQVVSHCVECKDAKALKLFERYHRSTLPTPTPTPEETPIAE